MDEADCRRRFDAADHAYLATAGDEGPHVVPVVLATWRRDGRDRIAVAVDHKPKRSTDLRRLRAVRENPRVAFLADHYEDDWSRLWWVRADAVARVVEDGPERDEALEQLIARHEPYRRHPPVGPVVLADVERWSGWTSAPEGRGARPDGPRDTDTDTAAADDGAGAETETETETETEVGVGPWPGPWPEDPRYDPALLAGGDRRNVLDRYRYWSVEAVVADLDTRRHPLHVAIENWAHDLNIGSVVRTANAYNVAGVHVVGRRRWNRRGAMVTDRYLHVHHHPDVAALAAWAAGSGVPLIGVDTGPGSVPLEGEALPRDCVLLFGQESTGLSAEARAACTRVLAIGQHGSTRSLNAGAAAAIAMFAWAQQHAQQHTQPPPEGA